MMAPSIPSRSVRVAAGDVVAERGQGKTCSSEIEPSEAIASERVMAGRSDSALRDSSWRWHPVEPLSRNDGPANVATLVGL